MGDVNEIIFGAFKRWAGAFSRYRQRLPAVYDALLYAIQKF